MSEQIGSPNVLGPAGFHAHAKAIGFIGAKARLRPVGQSGTKLFDAVPHPCPVPSGTQQLWHFPTTVTKWTSRTLSELDGNSSPKELPPPHSTAFTQLMSELLCPIRPKLSHLGFHTGLLPRPRITASIRLRWWKSTCVAQRISTGRWKCHCTGNEDCECHQTGIMNTRTGEGCYVVRAHPEVPYGLIQQRYA